VACKGIAEALARKGHKIYFLLPVKGTLDSSLLDFYTVSLSPAEKIASSTYSSLKKEEQKIDKDGFELGLVEKVQEYGRKAPEVIGNLDFDIIHAHDWLTSPAALAAKNISGKPLVFQVHASEFERSGGESGDPSVHSIEKEALDSSDACIAVSNHTKDYLVEGYGVASNKIEVVYNGLDDDRFDLEVGELTEFRDQHQSIVLYVGRLSLHKGGDWFLKAARKVLDQKPDTTFVIAGEGEMKGELLELASEMNLLDNIYFTGFLSPPRLGELYSIADAYVLPSVCEPFGITCLEAMDFETPAIVSKQSGVSEAINNILEVDFWDTKKMADYILNILRHKPLKEELSTNGSNEVKKLTWDKAAKNLESIYQEVL